MTIASLLSDDPTEADLEVALINAERRKFRAIEITTRYTERALTAYRDLLLYRQQQPKKKRRRERS